MCWLLLSSLWLCPVQHGAHVHVSSLCVYTPSLSPQMGLSWLLLGPRVALFIGVVYSWEGGPGKRSALGEEVTQGHFGKEF